MSNTARGKGKGPSRTSVHTTTAPAAVASDVAAITVRHSRPPSAFTRWGSALPSVSAPTITPSAVPLPFVNHVAMSFSAGG
jgi:hypothetical protein